MYLEYTSSDYLAKQKGINNKLKSYWIVMILKINQKQYFQK